MANTKIGSAYVQLMPSMKGFSAAVNRELKDIKINASVATSVKQEEPKNKKLFSDFGKNSASNFSSGLTSGIKAGTSKVGSLVASGFSQTANMAKTTAKGIANTFVSTIEATTKAVEVSAVATATAIGVVSLNAYKGYSSYEQLVGGVDTLFKESSVKVQEYAANAYKTAGINANMYMETVTGFSASLLQGLAGDTERAAEIANMALTDMADNANKMGTPIESIRYAYQGFAKDTYTMLDNLKLGYGGTQSEMARLINDSKVLGDSVEVTAETVKDVPFDKIIEAIHTIQTNLGITGTTAKEAAETLEGSANSVKASWSNLLTGIAKGNDKETKVLVDQFTDSLAVAAKNSLPRMVAIGAGIAQAFGAQIAPKTRDAIIEGLEDAGVSESTIKLFSGTFDAIESVGTKAFATIKSVSEKLKSAGLLDVLEDALDFVNAIASGGDVDSSFSKFWDDFDDFATDITPQVLTFGENFIKGIINFIKNHGGEVADGILSMLRGALQTVAPQVDWENIITGGNIATILGGAYGAQFGPFAAILGATLGSNFVTDPEGTLGSFKDFFTKTDWQGIFDSILYCFESFLTGLTGDTVDDSLSFGERFANAMNILGTAIKEVAPIAQMLGSIIKFVVDNLEMVPTAVAGVGGAQIGATIGGIVGSIFPGVGTAVGTLAGGAIGAAVGGIAGYATTEFTKISQAQAQISDADREREQAYLDDLYAKGEVADAEYEKACIEIERTKSIPDAILGAVKQVGVDIKYFFLGIPDAISGAFSEAGSVTGGFFGGIGEDFLSLFDTLGYTAGCIGDWFTGVLSGAGEWIGGVFTSITDFFGGVGSFIGEAVGGWWDDVYNTFIKPVIDFFTNLPETIKEKAGDIVDGFVGGIQDGWNAITGGASDLANGFIDTICNILGIHSPSRVMFGFGQNTVQGFVNGGESKQGLVSRMAQNIADNTTDPLGSAPAMRVAARQIQAVPVNSDSSTEASNIQLVNMLIAALQNVHVLMDGQKVGTLTSSSVDKANGQRGVFANRGLAVI